MWFKHSMSIAQQLIPIYNTTVHKNKRDYCCPLFDCLCHKLTTPTGHEGGLLFLLFEDNPLRLNELVNIANPIRCERIKINLCTRVVHMDANHGHPPNITVIESKLICWWKGSKNTKEQTSFPSRSLCSILICDMTFAACSPPITEMRELGHMYRKFGLEQKWMHSYSLYKKWFSTFSLLG